MFDPRYDRPATCAQCELSAVCYSSRTLCAVCELQRLIDNDQPDEAYEVALIENVPPTVVANMIRAAVRHAYRAREINAMHQAVRAMNATMVVIKSPFAASNDNALVKVCS